jgi:hypothetical protein
MFKQPRLLIPIILACALGVYPQISIEEANEVFAQIPYEQRATLTERLNFFIQLEKNGKWDESYKMISATYRQRIRGGYSLSDYKKEKNIKINKFDPRNFSSVNNNTVFAARPIAEIEGHYFIEGCGSGKGGGGKALAIIEAYWEKDDWYFSDMQALGMHELIKCNPRKKKDK